MKKIFNKKWLNAAIVRAIKTFGQGAVSTLGVCSIASGFDVKVVISALCSGAFAAVLSIFTSLAGLPEVGDEQ